MAHKYREIAFTPEVAAAQTRYYGRAQRVRPAPDNDPLGPDEAAFVAARDSFYLGTVNEAGWPYIQHRGGPTGFLHVLDPQTLAFADYQGNRQMISTGNLAANDRVCLFLIDYRHRTRLKIIGHARVTAAQELPDLVARLAPYDADAVVERVFLIDVLSFDWNCPQHITPRLTVPEVEAIVQPLVQRIAMLEAELAQRATSPQGR